MKTQTTETPAQILVTDRAGNSHNVLAAHRLDSFRVLVLRDWHSKSTPFVVHTFNEHDGGFHHGHYCETRERAETVFAGIVEGSK